MSFLPIASINTNGLRNDLKRNVLLGYLKDCNFKLVLLQETHSDRNDEVIWSKQWGGQILFNHGTRHSKGVASLTSKNSDVVKNDNDGRWIEGDFDWDEEVISVASVCDLQRRITFLMV